MENIYHYVTQLPDGFREAVLVCPDGYTVYTDSRLSHEEALNAYIHATRHIYAEDFYSDLTADQIELRAHS